MPFSIQQPRGRRVIFNRTTPRRHQERSPDVLIGASAGIGSSSDVPLCFSSKLNMSDIPVESDEISTDLSSTLPPIQDRLQTKTTQAQAATVQDCLPCLNGAGNDLPRNRNGLPVLIREFHEDFLLETLEGSPFQAYDAQRPWLVYWNLAAMTVLGLDVQQYDDRVIQLFQTLQNREGGIPGGYGHLSHVLTSYAAVLSATIIGPEALRIFDRRSMWSWLGQCKQADGGFAVSIGAEEDIRGAYCSMTVIALLNLPLELPPDSPARAAGLETFADKLPEWLSRCQTYEGGIAGAPGTEAHGAYAFCGLACACILGDPKDILPKYGQAKQSHTVTYIARCFDLPALIKWLSARQYAPEGGFSGRSNKLVDGCYSGWVGGCWPLISAAFDSTMLREENGAANSLYHRKGLIKFILSCCQQPDGGLRDKPTVYPDSYHSCYVLAGLSSAQHDSRHEVDKARKGALPSAFHWKTTTNREHPSPGIEDYVGSENVVEPVHPVFVIPYGSVEQAHNWAQG